LNSDASWPGPEEAQARVLGIQRKLHKWASDDPTRRFSDLRNLVIDPAFLVVAWSRVRGNRGARSAGVDGWSAYHVEQRLGVQRFLGGLREELRSERFRPAPVRERAIPKAGGKVRRLGSRRSPHTAVLSDEFLGLLVVTHPFHPLFGRRLEVLYVRREAAGRMYVCDGGGGRNVKLDEGATDRGLVAAERPLTFEVLVGVAAVVVALGAEREEG
jgi:hypothetical protein